MPHQIVMIVPKADPFTTLPEEYHTTRRIDCQSREAQAETIGTAMVDAVALALTHPHAADMTELHYLVMFATILQDDA